MTESIAKEKGKLLDDFNDVVADAEHLLKAVASAGGDKAQALRADVEESLRSARERLAELQREAVAHTKAVARSTDTYVHENPWRAIGIAAAVATAVGLLLGLLINRSR